MMKNDTKMRDVTIFVGNEKNQRVLRFLDKWYFKHKRRMNDQEIAYVAEKLECSPETMSKLQDAYL